jgi:diguanylate cyclase (GGDEF)-like protein/PAS domain S-box-containing protein
VNIVERILVALRLKNKSAPVPQNADSELLRIITENSADVICCLAPDLAIKYVSPSALTVFGRRAEEMIGVRPDGFIFPADLPTIAAGAMNLDAGHATATTQVRIVLPGGALRWVEATGRYAPTSAGERPDTVLVLRDIDDRKRREEELANMALCDGLTGLENRRAFDAALEREWDRAVREGGRLSLVLFDVDHFKGFNDQYGHQSGDDCLRAVATAIKSTARRQGDVVARYGGEEIVTILCDVDSAEAQGFAEAARNAVRDLDIPHAKNDDKQYVTVSVGVATALARHGGTMRMPEGLLMAADHALYKAKAQGRNRVEVAILLAPRGPAEVA